MLGQYFFVSAFIAVVFVLLGALVLSRNPKAVINKIFFAISITTGVWLVVNSVAGRSDFTILQIRVTNHITFLFGLLATFGLAMFSKVFTKTQGGTLWKTLVVSNVLSAILCLTPLTISGAKIVGDTNELEFGPLVTLYFLTVVANCLASAGLLIYHKKRYKGVRRSQTNLILGGFLSATIIIIITNIVFPSVFKIYALTSVGSFAIVFIIVAIATSIVTHKLFDIRLVVVRSLAYLFTLVTMAGIYGFVVLGLGRTILPFFSKGDYSERTQYIVYMITTMLLAATFQPIKQLFNKITNKVFYRDAYYSQAVLDQVSNVIVGNVDPHKVQKGALRALGEALRPTYALFLLTDSSNKIKKGHIIGQKKDIQDSARLYEVLKNIGKKITISDEIEDAKVSLKDTLRNEDIGAVAPLVTRDEAIGYLILGPKKSGNIYNSQDTGLLNIATNELAVTLQNAQRFEEIQAFNITLQEKITEATHELKSTNKKLIALDEAKDEFISMASHQLRTPLTSIKGYLSMMVEGDLGKLTKQQEKALKEAFGSSQRMVYLIADFLNVSRIKTGKFVIETKEVDLPEIVNEEITQLKEMAGAKDLTLNYEKPGVFPRVKLDDNKIRQVMMNIVDNAIYYTPSGGSITIQLYATSEEIIFKVVDTGIGVPKVEQHKLFTKFYRAGNAKKARPDGTGLGLFMAQKIVVEQGGAIIFESTEGKGSTFGFRFPLKKIKI